MGVKSKIQWTEASWNPATGCTKVSQGCKFCYAETWAKRKMGNFKDRKFTDVRIHEDRLDQPLKWRRSRKIFVNSMSDLFHESIPDSFIDKVFAVMYVANHHTYQILTKRPERMKKYLNNKNLHQRLFGEIKKIRRDVVVLSNWIQDHIWLGVSVEDQKSLRERVPLLIESKCAVKWLSVEPLLEEVDLRVVNIKYIDWVVVGGESGVKARKCECKWIDWVVTVCKVNGVPVFVKQLGSKLAKELNLKHGKGGDIEEFPEMLQVREYPNLTLI